MRSILVISGHDYASKRKASIHFIAREAAKSNEVKFLSLGFSPLLRIKGTDPRLGMSADANRIRRIDGVDCYLWRTSLHPFNPRNAALQYAMAPFYELYARLLTPLLKSWIAGASDIMVESGLQVILLPIIKRLNPSANVIYIASDDLETINCHPILQRTLESAQGLIDTIRLPSAKLRSKMPLNVPVYLVPHGIDKVQVRKAVPSPYLGGINAVSVGSMLFDAKFFHVASQARPDINFHVIGAGAKAEGLPSSVTVYPEMPYEKTLPYLVNADIGLATYELDNAPFYLADTSMKLMQFDYMGVPSLSPEFCRKPSSPGRFHYGTRGLHEISAALDAALERRRYPIVECLEWSGVFNRIMMPTRYPDTEIEGS